MSAVGKCSLLNRDYLMQPFHMQLSQNIKTFCSFIFGFSKFRLNFGHFPNKDGPHSLFISDATAGKKCG